MEEPDFIIVPTGSPDYVKIEINEKAVLDKPDLYREIAAKIRSEFAYNEVFMYRRFEDFKIVVLFLKKGAIEIV